MKGAIFNMKLRKIKRNKDSINYEKFDLDMTSFVNSNNIKSTTNYLITTSINNKFIYIYEKINDLWDLKFKFSCTVGKPQTPTIKGVFEVGEKYPSIGDENSSVKYAINITGEYYYHSIIYDAKGINVKDDRLGVAISHGCIRMATNSARWVYENVPKGSSIIIN